MRSGGRLPKRRIDMRFRLCFLAAAMVLVFCGFAQASTVLEYEADSLFRDAQTSFRSGLYQNALKSAHISREKYAEAGNEWGLARADNLIGEIEGVLSQNQLAEIYLSIAGEYYLSGGNDVVMLNRAIDMGGKSKQIYQNIGGQAGSIGVLKAEDIIQGATRKRGDIVNSCIREGDEYYNKAENALFSQYYLSAKEFASNASIVYNSCPYQAGIDKSAQLLTTINSRIDGIRVNAKAAYDRALRYFADGNMELCIQSAADAQSRYSEISDSEGYSSATLLLSRCHGTLDKFEEEQRREAQQHIEDAKRASIVPSVDNCISASESANKARAIYETLYSKAAEKERDLHEREQHKMKLYSALIYDVNSLMSKIQTTCGQQRMGLIAEDYYKRAQDFYLDVKLHEAISYASNARSIYENLKDYVGISKADTLIDQINNVMRQRSEADELLKQANARYNVASFDEALTLANRAKSIYRNIRDTENVKKVDDFILDVQEGSSNLVQANRDFNFAQTHVIESDYNSALASAKAANALYVQINYSIGIDESERIILLSERKIEEANAAFIQKAVFFGVLGALVIAILYQYFRRKRMLEMEGQMMKKAKEEEFRRRDEEFALRTEEDTKERVDDELKRLIQSERERMGDD
jgi:hypothetical protein